MAYSPPWDTWSLIVSLWNIGPMCYQKYCFEQTRATSSRSPQSDTIGSDSSVLLVQDRYPRKADIPKLGVNWACRGTPLWMMEPCKALGMSLIATCCDPYLLKKCQAHSWKILFSLISRVQQFHLAVSAVKPLLATLESLLKERLDMRNGSGII